MTSEIIATDGVDAVRIPYVSAAAGVTRPVVYKFFPNRHELIKGVLEDFREDFARRTPDILDTNDDAAVYVAPGGTALVQTVDFFTPIDLPWDGEPVEVGDALGRPGWVAVTPALAVA